MRNLLAAAGLLAGGLAWLATPGPTRAADHGDAPNIDNDSGADIADVFLFVDPNDSTKVCILGTVHGFIVPGEAGNFGTFDSDILYRFAIENTGDAKPDAFIDITFSERTKSTDPQTAIVKLPGKGNQFTAPTTPPTLAATANPQTVTTDPTSGVKFFAGEVDDPFFFDIPGFQRFVASVNAGSPDPSTLTRGRDTFAGYNVMGIALSLPRDLVRGAASNNKVGVEFQTYRRTQTPGPEGVIRSKGKFKQVDRMGNPAVNVALIPFAKKSAYNAASPLDDAKGKFASDIVATLNTFGTDTAHQQALAGVAITNGDYIRVDLTIPNTGGGGGDNAAAAFPNGRRLKDDTIDIILTIINNGNTLGDSVNASDIPPQDQFPFLALPQQPRAPGVIDDNTRN
jgi:hypothetical protein